MPTYTCVSKRGLLSADQCRQIAAGITRVHSAATGAPIAFTQCIFHDVDYSGHFIGGEPGPPDNVFVYGHIRGGRNVAQRAEILAGVRDLITEAVGCEPSSVWVYLNELEHTDMVEFGHVLPEHGGEAQWLESLPESLREHLVGLGRRAAS